MEGLPRPVAPGLSASVVADRPSSGSLRGMPRPGLKGALHAVVPVPLTIAELPHLYSTP